MGKTAKDKSVRRKAVPKRKQVKQQAPTIESYVRKLSKERLVEIVLKQVRSDESLERELLDEILERFGKPCDFIEHARQLVDNAVNTELSFDHRGYAKPVDYWPVRSAFERLFKEKQYETLLELGPDSCFGEPISDRNEFQRLRASLLGQRVHRICDASTSEVRLAQTGQDRLRGSARDRRRLLRVREGGGSVEPPLGPARLETSC